MNLEKNLKMSLLFDFYGKLLTPARQEVFEEYYFNNMSLAEVAENYNISRQAVLDSLKKSEKQLLLLEETLKMLEKYEKTKKIVEEVLNSKQTQKVKELLTLWEGNK